VFDAIAALVGQPAEIEDIRRQAATEGPDETVVNMDKIWEEEAVTFLASQETCSASRMDPREAQPVQWMPRPGSSQQPARSL
jgi:nitrate reductase delta subunit